MKLINIWKHFKKICIHKFYVAKFCFQAGLYYQGIMHDMSKFSPTEFIESVKYYQGYKSPIDACKKINGYSKAWLHHKGRNPHHYQYWCDNFDDYRKKGLTLIPMPYEYAVEMLCDYLGAAHAYNGNKFTFGGEYEWWKKKKNAAMHENTKRFIDECLFIMMEENSSRLLSSEKLKQIYNKYNQ